MYSRIKNIFYFCLELFFINAFFRRLNRGRIKTLLYHSLADKQEFKKQLEHLRRYYNVIRMSQDGGWVGLSEVKINVLITFDDGFRSDYELAFPALLEHGTSACFFLIADCVAGGTMPDFARKYINGSNTAAQLGTVVVPEAREMAEKGMAIGSHSTSHRDYSKLNDDEARRDAERSKKTLGSLLGLEITAFALPWGYYKPGQLEGLQEHYRRIFLTKHGFNRPEDRLLSRNEVSGTYHMYAAASGALDFFRDIVALRGRGA